MKEIDDKAVSLLKQQAGGKDVPQVLRAMWTLHALDSDTAEALRNENDIVRAWAVQLATEQVGKVRISAETLLQLAKDDASSTVRLALAAALPMLDAATTWDIASALAMHGEDKDDRFLPKMIWFGLARVIAGDFGRGLDLADKTALPSLADSIRWYAATSPEGRELLVARLLDKPQEAAAREVRLLAFGLKDEAKAPMPKRWPEVQAKVTEANATLDQLAVLFGDQAVLTKMRGILANEGQPLPERQRAFDLLKRSGDAMATPIFARLLDHEAFRSAVIPLLARSNEPGTAKALLAYFEKLNAADRSAALNTLTSRAVLALPLLHAVQSTEFDKKHLSALQVRQMRNLHDAEVDRLLDQTWGKINESSEAAKASIERLRKAYQTAPLWAFDARAGHETFKQICAVCHPLNGVGGKLGPDLAGSWRNGLDYFLENIIDPNAVVGDNFQLHIITRKDGGVLSGVIEQETDTAITLRTVTESAIIAKADLKDRQKLPQSIMPPGVLEALPERKAIELLKFLVSKQE